MVRDGREQQEEAGGAIEGGGRGQAASGRFQTRKRKRNRVSVIAESTRASRREEKKREKEKKHRKRERKRGRKRGRERRNDDERENERGREGEGEKKERDDEKKL